MKKVIIVITVLLMLSACANRSHCDAYGSTENINSEETNT